MSEQIPVSIKPREVSNQETISTGQPKLDLFDDKAVQPAEPPKEGLVPAPEDKFEEPKGPSLEQRFAELERREKMLFKKMQELDAKKSEAQPDHRLSQEEWLAKFRQDPTAVGVSYEDMVDIYAGQEVPDGDPEKAELKRIVAGLEKRLESFEKQSEESRTQSYENAKKQIRHEVGRLAGNEGFELIKITGSEDAVTEYIEAVYQEEGVLIPVEEAARDIESNLLEQAEAMVKLAKVQAKLRPEGAPEAPAQQTVERKTPSTLTHDLTRQTSRPLTKRERAMMILEGRKHELPEYAKG